MAAKVDWELNGTVLDVDATTETPRIGQQTHLPACDMIMDTSIAT